MTTSRERRAALNDRVAMYERMYEIRLVESHVQDLWNDGKIRGTTHLSDGQEAVAVGVAAASLPTDLVTCTYRGHAAALALGTSPVGVLGELLGRTVGCVGGLGGSMHLCDAEVGLFPTFAIIGAGIPVAVGAALSSSVKGDGGAAIAMFGDGTVNIGAFHEALNLASIWKLPAVFIIENNLYGEYTRFNLSTPLTDLAERAVAYAMPSAVVDGQDVDEVKEATQAALERARSGGGPTLLEMKTYRYTGHSKTDPAAYRPEGELQAWQDRDPVTLFATKLQQEGVATEAQLSDVRVSVDARIAAALEEALAAPEPGPDAMFEHIAAH